jgi:hypothetical protein
MLDATKYGACTKHTLHDELRRLHYFDEVPQTGFKNDQARFSSTLFTALIV